MSDHDDYHDTKIYSEKEMDATIAALTAENKRLQAIVDKLPKTADEVTVGPGDVVWLYDEDGDLQKGTVYAEGSAYIEEINDVAVAEIRRCYSTREAAEAAQLKEQANA